TAEPEQSGFEPPVPTRIRFSSRNSNERVSVQNVPHKSRVLPETRLTPGNALACSGWRVPISAGSCRFLRQFPIQQVPRRCPKVGEAVRDPTLRRAIIQMFEHRILTTSGEVRLSVVQ